MTVRAKFYVTELKQPKSNWGSQDGELMTTIRLAPVSGTSEENKQFFRWTPAGTIDLGTVNPEVAKQMHIGDEFYVDFIPVKGESE